MIVLQVHLSDHPGMEVLAQLLQAAVCSQLELSAPKSPAPVMVAPPPLGTASPQAVRRPPPRVVVVGEVAAPRRSDPFAWTVARGRKVLDTLISANFCIFKCQVHEHVYASFKHVFFVMAQQQEFTSLSLTFKLCLKFRL